MDDGGVGIYKNTKLVIGDPDYWTFGGLFTTEFHEVDTKKVHQDLLWVPGDYENLERFDSNYFMALFQETSIHKTPQDFYILNDYLDVVPKLNKLDFMTFWCDNLNDFKALSLEQKGLFAFHFYGPGNFPLGIVNSFYGVDYEVFKKLFNIVS